MTKSHFDAAMKNKVISALQNLTYEQLEAVNYFIVTLKKTGARNDRKTATTRNEPI